MRTITFPDEHLYDGDKVLIWVRIFGRSVELNMEMTLDTGASITVLNRKLIPVLGLNVDTGRPVELMVANKEVARAYLQTSMSSS
jgi:predicted aspartyl protease